MCAIAKSVWVSWNSSCPCDVVAARARFCCGHIVAGDARSILHRPCVDSPDNRVRALIPQASSRPALPPLSTEGDEQHPPPMPPAPRGEDVSAASE
jgi:hypothetical protein